MFQASLELDVAHTFATFADRITCPPNQQTTLRHPAVPQYFTTILSKFIPPGV